MDEMKAHLIKALDKDVRFDGRRKTDYRKITIEQGLYPSAEGSSRVIIGNTEVIAGVKMEVKEPYSDDPENGTIMIGAEFTPLASPEFELGPPGIDAIELARVVDRAVRESHMIKLDKLCIKSGELVWVVVLDLVPMNDDGNLFDAAYLAALAAIKNTQLPKVVDGKIDYTSKTDERLPLAKEPISITVFKIGKNLIVDPTREEEKMLDCRLTVAIGEDENIYAMQKGGDGTLTAETLKEMISIAKEKAKELRKIIKNI